MKRDRGPCCSELGIKRGRWTAEEDKILKDYISTYGEGKWANIPKVTDLRRCGKSCRLRWVNYLRPNIKRGDLTDDEVDLIVRLHRLLGNRWSLIAGRLPGRTDNEIKNYWNTMIAKKVLVRQVPQTSNHKVVLAGDPQQKQNISTTHLIRPTVSRWTKKSFIIIPQFEITQLDSEPVIKHNTISDAVPQEPCGWDLHIVPQKPFCGELPYYLLTRDVEGDEKFLSEFLYIENISSLGYLIDGSKDVNNVERAPDSSWEISGSMPSPCDLRTSILGQNPRYFS